MVDGISMVCDLELSSLDIKTTTVFVYLTASIRSLGDKVFVLHNIALAQMIVWDESDAVPICELKCPYVISNYISEDVSCNGYCLNRDACYT